MVATFQQMDRAAEAVFSDRAAQILPCAKSSSIARPFTVLKTLRKIGLPLDCEALLLLKPMVTRRWWPRKAEDGEHFVARTIAIKSASPRKTKPRPPQLASAAQCLSALARLSPTTILEDATVPRSELGHMIRFVAEVAEKHQLKVGTFGHMGDGNLHPPS